MKSATESVFCWLLTSPPFHAEVGRATNEDAAWEKKCFLYNLRLLYFIESRHRSPSVLFFFPLLLLIWLKECKAERSKMRGEIIQPIRRLCLLFSFHWKKTKNARLGKTHANKGRAHLRGSVHTHKEPFSEREQWFQVEGGDQPV